MTTRRTKVDAMIAGMERKVLLCVVAMVADFCNGGCVRRRRQAAPYYFGPKRCGIFRIQNVFVSFWYDWFSYLLDPKGFRILIVEI